MKNITNKTLGIVGIVVLILSYITNATDSNGVAIFPLLGLVVFISYIIFIIISSSRLWKNSKNLILGFIIFCSVSLISEIVTMLVDLQIIAIVAILCNIISIILTICVISRLFKKEVIKNVNQPMELTLGEEENNIVLESKKESFWSRISSFVGTGFGILIVLLLIVGWGMNLVKFFRLDFREPFKAEVIRGIGLAPTPIGSILGYISIKDY